MGDVRMSKPTDSVQPVPGRPATVPKGKIFDVLQNKRRRFVLQYLRRHGGPVELGTLASQVAAWEYETTLAEISKKQRKRVYTTLQQTHLPKMNEAGFLSYDPEDGVIDTTPQTEDLTVYLEIVPGGEFPWREYYLSLGTVSLAIVVVFWVGVYPFTLVNPLAWATIFTVVLTVSAGYHTFFGHQMTLSEYEETDDLD